MSVTLDTIPNIAIVRDLADVVAVKPDGTRWKARSIKQLQLSCAGLLTKAIEDSDGAEVTLRALLTADAVKAAVNTASVPPLAKHVRRMLLKLDAGADTGALDTLIAYAEASNKERAQVANGNTPSYSLFHDAALQLAQCLDTDGDVPLTTLSKCVYMLLLTAVCPGRERMFLYLRAADSDCFNADEDHTRDVLEALRAEHPKHADSMTLATVLFTAGEPTTLIVGVHGCSDPRKNEYYHEVDLTSPILPAAQDLLPLLHDGLKLLYHDYEAESFLTFCYVCIKAPTSTMAQNPFDFPEMGSARAQGFGKFGSSSGTSTDIIRPGAQQVDDAFQPGRVQTIEFKADQHRFWSPRQTRLALELEFMFGEVDTTCADAVAGPVDGKFAPPSRDLYMTALPGAQLFNSQVRFSANNTVIEQTNF